MREKEDNLSNHLLQEGDGFQFFEAARRGSRMVQCAEGVDGPTQIRFATSSSKVFPKGEVAGITQTNQHLELVVNLFGLLGHTGVLPKHDWDFLASRRSESFSLPFLNLFHHRQIEAFFDAWKKHRIDIAREEAEWDDGEGIGGEDSATLSLLALAGYGISSVRKRHDFPDFLFVGLASYFARPVRTPESLARSVRAQYGISAEVKPFVPNLFSLPKASRSSLGETGAFNVLGKNVVLGKSVPNHHSRFELVLGPLSEEQLRDLSPFQKGNAFPRLLQFVQAFCGSSLDFDLRYRVDSRAVRRAQLGQSILGFDTWLLSEPSECCREEPVFRFTWGQSDESKP